MNYPAGRGGSEWMLHSEIIMALIVAVAALFPSVSFATSGTCSGHYGVNCSVGQDYDGSAVCNDGWRDSSEWYSSQALCQNSTACTTSDKTKLFEAYSVPDLEGNIEKLNLQISTLTSQALADILTAENRQTIQSQIDGEIAQIKRQLWMDTTPLTIQINSLNGQLTTALTSADQDCAKLGTKEAADRLQQQLSQLQAQQQAEQAAYQQSLNQVRYTCPSNSILSGDKCYCPSGLSWNGTSCVITTQPVQTKVMPVDPYAGSSNDERCVKLGLGNFFNSEKQSCDSCPSGTTHVSGTNVCEAPRPVPAKAVKPVQPVATPAVVSSSAMTSSASTTLQATTSSVKQESKPKGSLWQKITSPLTNLWRWAFSRK